MTDPIPADSAWQAAPTSPDPIPPPDFAVLLAEVVGAGGSLSSPARQDDGGKVMPKLHDKAICENCQCFAPHGPLFGECHAHAPSVPVESDLLYSWPSVEKNSWCVEWREAGCVEWREAEFLEEGT